MSRSHSSLSEHIFNTTFHPSQFFQTVHIFPYPLAMTSQHHRMHGQQDCLVVWPHKSPFTGYEPNAIVEISSAEVPPIHHPPRRTSFCSVYNFGEDATSVCVSWEVGERQSFGRLASPLLMKKREASAIPARIYHSTHANHTFQPLCGVAQVLSVSKCPLLCSLPTRCVSPSASVSWPSTCAQPLRWTRSWALSAGAEARLVASQSQPRGPHPADAERLRKGAAPLRGHCDAGQEKESRTISGGLTRSLRKLHVRRCNMQPAHHCL